MLISLLLYSGMGQSTSTMVYTDGTDLMQRRTCEWHALESDPLSTKILSIYYQVRVDALVKYTRRKHSQQALTEYLISNSSNTDLTKPSQAPLYR